MIAVTVRRETATPNRPIQHIGQLLRSHHLLHIVPGDILEQRVQVHLLLHRPAQRQTS